MLMLVHKRQHKAQAVQDNVVAYVVEISNSTRKVML